MITENLSTLKIHKLTQEQYNRELKAGNIDANALYITTGSVPYEINKNGDTIFKKDVMIDEQTSIRDEVSKIGDLTNYWQYNNEITNIIAAINQNASWASSNFEQLSNKTQDILSNPDNENLYTSSKAVYDLVKMVYDLTTPHIIYDNSTGFEANDKDIGDSWQLTGLDLSMYKKLKFYIKSAGDGNTNWSPSHIVELHLDDRARGSNGHFTAGHTAVCPNATGRFHSVIVSVNADKTALAFNRSNRYNLSTSATSIEGRRCYLIEGYMM